jgi:hypothetical protein
MSRLVGGIKVYQLSPYMFHLDETANCSEQFNKFLLLLFLLALYSFKIHISLVRNFWSTHTRRLTFSGAHLGSWKRWDGKPHHAAGEVKIFMKPYGVPRVEQATPHVVLQADLPDTRPFPPTREFS